LTLLAATLNNQLKGEGPVRRTGLSYFQMTNIASPPLPTVLVVDDDALCRSMVATTLSRQGFDVIVASDGYRAIGALSRFHQSIRLLIVDTEMPGLHGWEVIRFGRSKNPKLRALRLGRGDDAPPGMEYQTLRSVSCLSKPFTPDRLLATIRRRRRGALR
jgi:two-component system chemotaxis response regulator CheY